MRNELWIETLQALLARFSHLGIAPDTSAMTACELWGLYCFLQRLASEE
jgi:hypothetical protein